MGERMRIRLDLAYDGTGFSGWAAQPGLRTVEDELSRALTTMLRAPDPVRLTVAGRTDAGVHARGQVAHADVDVEQWTGLPGRSDRTAETAAQTRLAGILPGDITVHRVRRAADGFDARFSATSRRYRYRIADDDAVRDPLRRWDTVRVKDRLDLTRMTEASRQLLGLRDFAAFCKRREGATTVRTLLDFSWTRETDGVLSGTVVADAFCHSMVRSLVGAQLAVGEGRRAPDWPAGLLRHTARASEVTVVRPHGLTLVWVDYPEDDQLAARAEQTRALRHPDGRLGAGDVATA